MGATPIQSNVLAFTLSEAKMVAMRVAIVFKKSLNSSSNAISWSVTNAFGETQGSHGEEWKGKMKLVIEHEKRSSNCVTCFLKL